LAAGLTVTVPAADGRRFRSLISISSASPSKPNWIPAAIMVSTAIW
jgi:hypothetical protein